MPLFTSSREKQLWIYALLVLIAIFSTLILGPLFVGMLGNQNLQAFIFMFGMLLIGVTIIVHGLKIKPGKTEIAIWLGFTAVYIMLFLRLGLPERSHLVEYSVLAIFIHKALIERLSQENQLLLPGLFAFVVTTIIGVFDECIQIVLPDRVFDPLDILFNSLAALMAIGTSLALQWARKKFSKFQ